MDQQAADRKWKKKEVIAEGFKNKTKGEAWFNTFSYIGVGYGLVTATSVFLTWLLNDTHKFVEKYGNFAERITTRFGWPRSIASIGTLFLGGTIASVLPVKWLEDKKPQIVKKLDRMLYTDDELNDPKIREAHRELNEMPKQTWASVFSSRIVAFAATFAIFFLMGSNKSPLARHTGESIDKRSTQFGRWLDSALHKGNETIQSEIKAAKNLNAKMIASGELMGIEVIRKEGGDRVPSRIWSYIALDAFYTAFTSASLFIFTRVFGGLIGKDPAKEQARIAARRHAAANADQLESTITTDQPLDTTKPEHLTATAEPVTKVTGPRSNNGKLAHVANQEHAHGAA